MRIRKQASNLLGWAAASSPSSSGFRSSTALQSSLPPPRTPGRDASGELQCRLNLSPWDAIGESRYCTNFQDMTAAGAMGYGLEGKEEQFIDSSASETTALSTEGQSEEEVKEKTAIVKKERKTMKRREAKKMETTTEALDDHPEISPIKYCKKTDGKRWHCKRPAQLPHSLCGYHRTQLRSYTNLHREEASLGGACKKKLERLASVSDFYYYYSVFGPWRSKLRGSPFEGVGRESSEFHQSSAVKSDDGDGERKKVIGQVCSAPTDDDGEEEKEKEGGGGDGGNHCKYMQLGGERRRQKKPLKKRGRKRVKARSLKSLL